MYSFSFPDMVGSTTSKLLKDKEAIASNLRLLFGSEQYTHFGDPYFGCQLKRFIFEQSNQLVADLIIDEIYTRIVTFMPQLAVERKNIEVYVDKNTVKARVLCTYMLDNTSDLYVINLTNSESF